MTAQKLSTIATASIGFVAIGRCFAGGIMLLAPRLGGQLFGISLSPESQVFGRLFGIRDLTLGVLLWKVSSAFHSMSRPQDNANLINPSAMDLRTVLTIGVLIDLVDVVSCLISAYRGEIQGKALFWGPCGAAIFAGLQWLARRDL
ncbi:Uncharacterized protein PECH_005271 [Penicillium ucsense]|uniref:Uncharacterized protein n=1 Tax=Penicillium ucsense TaxID=2839758 RepID=A0A8J8VVA0_9EURO|nr:Uncharacterized protein PECM_004836 [Penicillium ucsense]KAF7724437.1 Uncharacterized protein PECH_005271 [Penicillium ucsense]